MINNTITQNSPMPQYFENSQGSGITLWSGSVIHGVNDIVFDNIAQYTPEIYNNGGTVDYRYTCCAQTFSGTGNITDNPEFYAPEENNFNLSQSSPCIDAGHPSSQLDPDSTRADMGALYYDQSTGVQEGKHSVQPSAFRLCPAYPNPFNSVTTIRFSVATPGQVSLTVYDVMGREVARIVDRNFDSGYHSVVWDAANLSSGVYLCRMEADRFTAVRKLVFMQ